MGLFILGSIGQWLSLVAIAAGIAVELRLGADIGFFAITGGSVLYAVATKAVEIYWKRKAKHGRR